MGISLSLTKFNSISFECGLCGNVPNILLFIQNIIICINCPFIQRTLVLFIDIGLHKLRKIYNTGLKYKPEIIANSLVTVH